MPEQLDFKRGAEWGVRLFMGRAPRPEDLTLADNCRTVDELRARFVASDEVQNWHRYLGSSGTTEKGLDFFEGSRWTYRLALRREPSEQEVQAYGSGTKSILDLQRVFTGREFEVVSKDILTVSDAVVFRQFAPLSKTAPLPGCFGNCVGGNTRVAYLPPSAAWKAGKVEGVPDKETPGLHGLAEWVGTLRSVLEARDRFVAIELGAGWAPWLVSSALAAKKRGISNCYLVGVEGAADHYAYMLQNFKDNGLNPADHELIHAVVAAEDGTAYFPKLVDPTMDYGAHAVFNEEDKKAAVKRGELEAVKAVGLGSLLKRTGRVDMLHMDIQGHEVDVLSASMPEMNTLVRRAIIGTHSRMIDAQLFELFVSNGWHLERELPTVVAQAQGGNLYYPVDGEQIWRNNRV